MTELIDAICKKDSDEARRLIEAGADVNARDNLHNTPLHISVQFENAEITQLLIEAGADINALNGSYQTPMFKWPPNVFLSPSQKLLFYAGAAHSYEDLKHKEIKQLLTAILHNLEGSEDNTVLKDMIIKVMMGKLE